ncbi:MAG: xylulokinase [Phycisphaerae bacterium]|nr:xylulokinase [Phycisphaerae bacterium]
MALLLGIDVGTSATKTLLCTAKGRVLATASAEYPVYAPEPGWSEQDPNDWWRAVIQGIGAVCKKAGKNPTQITGVGLSGQMHGSVFVDRAGQSLRRALLWNDQRTVAECAEIERLAGGRSKLIGMVNNVALTGFTAPKILWVRTHDPRAYEQTFKVLLPKDYIRLRLTGEYASEVSDAAGTLLLDVKGRKWHRGLLGKLRINPDLLPAVHESTVVTGEVNRAAARATGLAVGTPVVGGAGDQPAGAIGNGIVQAGIVSATMGTSGVVFAHSDKPVPNKAGNLQSFCHAVPGKWCVFGCMLAAGGSFQWLRNTWCADEVAALRKAKKDPGVVYTSLIKLAEKAPPGCEGLFFLPYLTGERCPYPDPDARGAWIGLTVRHDRASLVRAVLEGITFGMRDQIEIMRAGGLDIREVRAGGGGAASPWWRQLQADIYDATVTTINTQEGAAYGVALLAGVGTGVFKTVPEACEAGIRITDQRKPTAKLRKRYDSAYAQYRRLYPSLAGEFKRIAEVTA